MFRKRYSLWVGLLTLLSLFAIYPAVGFSELTIERAVKKEIEKRVVDKEIIIVPQLNKITTGFGRDKSGEFYWIKTTSKIFFQDKNVTVKITDISFKDDGVIFELWSDALGGGKVRVFFNEEGPRQLSADEIEGALRFSLAFEKSHQVVVNTKSNIFHLHTCNHLPESKDSEEMSMSEAGSKGHKACGYCFTKHTYLPYRHLENPFSKQIAAGQIATNPLVIDPSVQNYIQEVGNSVLKKWPLPLIGYEYRFNVVESKMFKAISLPIGYIIVTSALLNSLENEGELEAILAQQIAHIERRHILRTVSPLIKQQENAQTMSHIAAGMAAGAAIASVANNNFNQSTSFSALSIAIMGLNIDDVNFSGYPNDYEREADDLAIFYFDQNYMDKKHLENVIRKSEFLNLVTTPTIDIESLEAPYNEERIARVWQTTFNKFDNKHFVCGKSDKHPSIQFDLLYQSNFNSNLYIFIYMNDENFFVDKTIRTDYTPYIYIKIKDEKGIKIFETRNEETIKDTWGNYIVLKGRFSEPIGNVEKLWLILHKLTGQNSMDYEDESYDFKEGVITVQ